MHRFRKKSDVKRSQAPVLDAEPQLSFLPPVSDFRTSLILPDLSRRFSLLRTPTGDPVTVDDLRTKFAEHRAKGSQHTISEEEEEMLLSTLSRLRVKATGTSTPERSQESINGNESVFGEDEEGSNSSATIKLTKGGSSVTSSPSSSRSTKRYSNNLFGSGRLRDHSYLRSVARTSAASNSSKSLSLTPSEGSSSTQRGTTSSIEDSLRPSTPPGATTDDSVQSSSASVDDQGSTRSSTLQPIDPAQVISMAEYRLQKSLGPAGLKRASLALESAIQEIEDDVEEEIVMPRSTPIPRNHVDHQHPVGNQQLQRQLSGAYTRDAVNSILVEAGMAISSDRPIDAYDPNAARGPSPVPLNVTPGYIPGMPRPMTPRDFDVFSEDQRSHSTTPRATSPMHNSFTLAESATASVSISKMLRRDSTSSTHARQSPRPTTPMFLQRSTQSTASVTGSMNGRQTPIDDQSRSYGDTSIGSIINGGGHSSFDRDQSLSSSVLSGRRRPASPLASPPFQPLQSSPGLSISRPTTPSKIVWAVNPDESGGSSFGNSPVSPRKGHSRDNSWASDGAMSESELLPSPRLSNAAQIRADLDLADLERTRRSGTKSPKNAFVAHALKSSESESSIDDSRWSPNRPPSRAQRATSPLDESTASQPENSSEVASQNRNHRSLTPTQNPQRSPASPTFGHYGNMTSRVAKRSSRQNAPSSTSPFDFGPIPSLTLNPRANLSNSSLESRGSSFHSWSDDNNDKVLSIFNDIDAKPAWHDIPTPSSGKSSSSDSETHAGDKTISNNGAAREDDWDAEEIIKGYAGLKKTDFATIQEKLVVVARNAELRGSVIRKRRPSTSQSNYSTRDHRVASPPPSSPGNNVHSPSRDQHQRPAVNHSADLQTSLSAPVLAPSLSSSSIDRETGLRRNLTQVLFGGQEEENRESVTPSSPTPASATALSGPLPDIVVGSAIAETSITELLQSVSYSPEATSHPRSPTSPSAYLLNRNPSTTRLGHQSPQEQAALAFEMQQKVQAATLALRKPSSNEGIGQHTALPRKRIDPSKISGPTLVSASTSVDAIPLKTPSLTSNTSSGSLKIGSRFRKLRGSLRAAKPAATIDENGASPADSTSPAAQVATYDHEKLKAASGPNSSGAAEATRYKIPVPSPPASAGPGLKGFMARFRTKRATDIPQSTSSSTLDHHQGSPQLPLSPMSPLSKHFPISPTTPNQFSSNQYNADSGYTVTTPRQEHHRLQAPSSPLSQQNHIVPDSPPGGDSEALQQFLAAATKIGIDHSALNDFLARSGSVSSRNLLNHSGPVLNSGPNQGHPNAYSGDSHLAVPIQQPNLSSSSGSDHTATPAMFSTSQSSVTSNNGDLYGEEGMGAEEGFDRRASTKRPEHLRKQRDTAANAVVRRTLIFIDPRQSTVDHGGVLRRSSTKRRRTSVQSVSNRSVHDRVPTPPPSKTPIGKRFSHDGSPPVPQLPQSLGGQAENLLPVPPGGFGNPQSGAYDSVYELYGDSRVPSMMVDSSGQGDAAHAESGTGVEVIELANGETIWKIVNGLRDDDDESVYTGRNSVSSEYSTRETTEGLQVFVKEHVRAGSKGSNSSFVSRKKGNGGKARPETKVMYSSPEQVAHLIEQLSHGMEAGSFNFLPYRDSGSSSGPRSSAGLGHSATSSLAANEITWTMKEIDHMLTTMGPRS
ncbi:hypothetical protein FA15DRAFT_666475 [Coprinopsis marcescibilis]|uniref:Uncharacterized protein n=1 Tax=Coprinopsis marcescibilis TaxID=230819 RepID=A0A5C3L431_COPMA|nr:hypothetical protein FA15DRAFT_666475 [Coprinopsis marcescibilis]